MFLVFLLSFVIFGFLVAASYVGDDKETLCDSLVRNTIAVYNTVITQVLNRKLPLSHFSDEGRNLLSHSSIVPYL